MNETDTYEMSVGTHSIRVDGDTVMVTVRGLVTAEGMQAFTDVAARIRQKHNGCFSIYDVRECTGIDVGARKVAAKQPMDDGQTSLRVLFGVSFTLRVVLSMLIRAQKALFNRDVQGYFFEDEKEGREFFEKERERLRKNRQASPAA